jgi:adenosine deaminase
MLELAAENGVRLPEALVSDRPMRLDAADERGWFRFQRMYDTARSVLRREDDVRRLVSEVAEDERAEGSGWLEIQVDPSGYAARFGGLTAFTELVLDSVASASAATGVGIGVIIGANRTRHPLDARTLARLAVQYADSGVVGFGLANDERRGRAEDFAAAFRIARGSGLLATPHGGELAGPDSVLACVELLGADRVGHGVRSAENPRVLERLATGGITCEVCPASNVALGVYREPEDVPLRRLLDAGVLVALGADDPLLFGSRLADQYVTARDVHGLDDGALAELARMSVRASRAPADLRTRLLGGVDDWAADPVRASSRPGPVPA